MKNFLLIIFIGIGLHSGYAQTCCTKPEAMALMAANPDFIAAHDSPLQLDYVAQKGQTITYTTPDGKTATAFAVLADSATDNVVFVFHEWWGLNDYIKQEAENLQKELGNVSVYAVDLYDGQVAADRSKASELAQGLDPKRATAIIDGLIAHVGKNKKIATLGWCMGGGWSLQATLEAKEQAKACVVYYGFPEQDTARLRSNLKTDILFVQALQDDFITPQVVSTFEQNVKTVGGNITVKTYDAMHAFANPSNPKHNKEFTDEAYKLSVAFIKKGLKIK
jgi:carboxymethylenebutenolidase